MSRTMRNRIVDTIVIMIMASIATALFLIADNLLQRLVLGPSLRLSLFP